MKEAIATVMHSLLPPLLIQDEKKHALCVDLGLGHG